MKELILHKSTRTNPNKKTYRGVLGPKNHMKNYQISIVYEMFENLDIPLSRIPNMYKEIACKRTGVSWVKIYKYIFDKGKLFKCNKRAIEWDKVNKYSRGMWSNFIIFDVTKHPHRK